MIDRVLRQLLIDVANLPVPRTDFFLRVNRGRITGGPLAATKFYFGRTY